MATLKQSEKHIFSSSQELYRSAAEDFTQQAKAGINARGSFSVILSGGNTPKDFYATLALPPFKDSIAWPKILFFFEDERYVPQDNPASNYLMAKENLFSKVPISPKNIFPIPTDYKDPKEAATAYQQTIRQALQVKEPEIPCWI